MRLTAPALVAALLATAAHAQQFRISRPEVEHAEDVDFTAFSHYAWKSSQDPGDDPAAHATVVFEIAGPVITRVTLRLAGESV